ncbi:hypothetical protein B0H11DRAFT_1346889 [Mycena galericulata]|nr:hypothetical protein B0H11DRAFT_1346889 [Mycena galericulata]
MADDPPPKMPAIVHAAEFNQAKRGKRLRSPTHVRFHSAFLNQVSPEQLDAILRATGLSKEDENGTQTNDNSTLVFNGAEMNIMREGIERIDSDTIIEFGVQEDRNTNYYSRFQTQSINLHNHHEYSGSPSRPPRFPGHQAQTPGSAFPNATYNQAGDQNAHYHRQYEGNDEMSGVHEYDQNEGYESDDNEALAGRSSQGIHISHPGPYKSPRRADGIRANVSRGSHNIGQGRANEFDVPEGMRHSKTY